MSDDQNMSGTGPEIPQGEPSVLPAGPKPKAGPAGRNILLVVAAAIVLLAIVGVVGYVVLSTQTITPVSTPVVTTPVVPATPATPSTPTSGSAVTSGALPVVPDVTNRDVFTPRDPFQPIAAPVIASTTTTSSSSTSSTTDSTTLVLSDIKTVSGVRKAVVKLGGKTYTVGNGETVGSSSWKVVQVNSSNVVFLFGDERITISLGQGTSK